MSLRLAFEAAEARGMKISLSRSKPGIGAIECRSCGFGSGLFDQVLESYAKAPYGCCDQGGDDERAS